MTNDDRARVLRAMRGWVGADRAPAAAGMGMSDRTLMEAELGRACSAQTWAKALAWYDEQGLQWLEADADAPAMIVVHAD